MQQINWLVTGLAALIPMIMGMIWYSKPVFGNTWMRINRFREEDMRGGNMVLIFGLALLFSFLIALSVNFIVIHQFALGSIAGGPAADEATQAWVTDSMARYGKNFRTFKHGVLHGVIFSIMTVLPIIGIPALFERRGWKYVLIHLGYWVISIALMGGVICQWS